MFVFALLEFPLRLLSVLVVIALLFCHLSFYNMFILSLFELFSPTKHVILRVHFELF